jgi:hypothetical protein
MSTRAYADLPDDAKRELLERALAQGHRTATQQTTATVLSGIKP